MTTLKTTIDIGATAENVWSVLTDFSSYPKWNPFIREVQGKPEKGQRLKVRMRLSPKRSHRFAPRVIKVLPRMELHWRWRWIAPGLFTGEHAFIIIPNGVRGVKFIQRETFSGLLVPLILPFISKRTLVGFERMNDSLKKIAEARDHKSETK